MLTHIFMGHFLLKLQPLILYHLSTELLNTFMQPKQWHLEKYPVSVTDKIS